MAQPLSAQLVRLFEYEARCSQITADTLGQARARVDEAGLAALAAPLERAVGVFAHIQGARRLWLSRVSTLTTFPPDGVFPAWSLDQARREAAEMDRLWVAFAHSLDDAALAREIAYTSTENVAYASTLADICTHVINHSSYHRGQIAMLVAQTGQRPGVTDYIALTRARR
jgi:uncharacterized damage-inducible protein DinB